MQCAPARVEATTDETRVVGAVTLAFVADPAMRWLYPDPHQYLTGFPSLVRVFARSAFDHASAHEASDFAGVAIWLPPGLEPDRTALARVIETTVGLDRAPTIFEALERLDRCHPAAPHWYLPFIGVDPPLQGRGLGSRLLRHALEQVDREHRPAFLETANPVNIPLYQRHGFAVTNTIELPSAPALFAMVRPAQPG